ncbi:transcriptional regulator [Parvibium lacunae]|uniref:Helix-turn-helix domain-containing protein n=1 Tax=Parvibium lacunae TaxID=1888893 RepID=A0A368L048_9BURK|nr:YdaS family helix-turn-helix protein [Parvibium lacunae]RCS56792.1 hypothetical protein DU000_10655 [Parvibium lacunae]
MKLVAYLNFRGAQAQLAKDLGVSPVLIHQWAMEKRPVPIVRCLQIEQMTSGYVSRQELRPHDWQRIWPELLESQSSLAHLPSSSSTASTVITHHAIKP